MSIKRKAEDEMPIYPSTTATTIPQNHTAFMKACENGNLAIILSLLEAADADDNVKQSSSINSNNITSKQLLAATQDQTTGKSPLMIAAQCGHLDICQTLIDVGAPWNAVDRYGKCAGDYATDNQKWDVVNYLVEVGTKAEVRSFCAYECTFLYFRI